MLRILFIVFIVISANILATVPADISFMVIDLKYNVEDGVKICEMEPGLGCFFYGCHYLTDTPFHVGVDLCQTIEQFQPNGILLKCGINKYLYPVFPNRKNWKIEKFSKVVVLPKIGKKRASNPYNLSDYHGFLIATPRRFNYPRLRKKYPGILFLNEAFFSYFGHFRGVDKGTMNQLFMSHPLTENLRPKSTLYSKGTSSELCETILENFISDFLVIKPRGTHEGKGVIILPREDLHETLMILFGNTAKLKNHPDKSFNFWPKDPHDTFIIEEFIPSIPVQAPQLENAWYDGTMRVPIILTYNQGIIDIQCLCFTWKLAKEPLSAEASLTDKHKSYSSSGIYFLTVSHDIASEVESQLKTALPHLYKKLLKPL